nr:hypothetical protein [Mycobacterium avium]
MTPERQRRTLDAASEQAEGEVVIEGPQLGDVHVAVVDPGALHGAALTGGAQPEEGGLVQQRQPRH